MRLCSVSIDLDEIACYAQIHGIESAETSHAVYDVALARIRSFTSALALPVTLFVIARDLNRNQNADRLRGLIADGHEVGNHSLDHLYDLTRRAQAEQELQVNHANQRLSEVLGVVPSGFRAPGYTVTDELLSIIQACGLTYDSSVFPCPPYFAAKAARLVRMKLGGQNSRAVLDAPRVLRAPTVPYRVGSPYWTSGRGLLELPIQVAGPLRLPFIGTALSLLGPGAARLLTRALIGQEFINLELHGIDFLDALDVPPAFRDVQPDLRVSVARKLDTFSAVLELLRGRGYATVRLDEAARAFS